MTVAEAINKAKKVFIMTATCDGGAYRFQVTKTDVRRSFSALGTYEIPNTAGTPADAEEQWNENVGAGISFQLRRNFGEHTLTIILR